MEDIIIRGQRGQIHQPKDKFVFTREETQLTEIWKVDIDERGYPILGEIAVGKPHRFIKGLYVQKVEVSQRKLASWGDAVVLYGHDPVADSHGGGGPGGIGWSDSELANVEVDPMFENEVPPAPYLSVQHGQIVVNIQMHPKFGIFMTNGWWDADRDQGKWGTPIAGVESYWAGGATAVWVEHFRTRPSVSQAVAIASPPTSDGGNYLFVGQSRDLSGKWWQRRSHYVQSNAPWNPEIYPG